MLRHIVWWRLKPEAEGFSAQENAARLKEMGEAMNGKIPGLISVEVSCDIKPSSNVNAELVLMSTHPDADALQAYAIHPVHQEYVQQILACTEGRQSLDFEV